MKTTKYPSILAAIAALSLVSTQAAEKTTRITTREQSYNTTSGNDRDFGQIERWNKLKGREAVGTDNQKLGKLEDAVVDLQSGHILYAIVGSGGVLSVGEKKFAIAPEAFTDMSGNNLKFN